MKDTTEKFLPNPLPIISAKEKIIVTPVDEGIGATIGGLGSRSAQAVTDAINAEGNLITDIINARLDTSAAQILGDFTFGASGALTIQTDANNGLWLSPTGILAKKSGSNTLTVTNAGDVTLTGTITATAGAIGGWNISATALYYDGATDVLSAGMASTDYPFYAGKKYANRATAPFRVTPAGVMYATGAVIDGTSTIAGITGTQISYVATSTADIVPTGLAYSTGGISTGSDGSQSAYVVLTWNAISSNTFDYYSIRYKKAALIYYTYIPATTNTITIEGLTPNVSYHFGICSVNKYGTSSAFSTNITQTTASDTVAPATVTAGSATAGIQYIIVEWVSNTESDLASYNIYRNTTDNSATATLIGNCRTNYFVDGGRTGDQIYYYWVKAVDTSGNLSAGFSTVKSAIPRNVTSDDIVTIAGSKVLIDGAVYLSNWRHTTDLTKIDGGDIYTGSVTTTQLNFTPVQSTDVIAKINASAEGITIDADNLTINAATTFASGYNPVLKVNTFSQDAIPTSIAIGDLWTDNDDDNKLYRAASVGADEIKAGEWILVRDTGIATAIQAAADAQATADGKVITFYQATAPTAEATGDLWIDTDDDRLYRWSGSQWIEIQDVDISTAIANAATAQTTADGKIVSFYVDEPPTAEGEGDLWFDTNDNKKPYRWSGSAWVEVQDANKLNALAGSYASAASGARVRIFPDANTGIQVIDDATNDVFKVIVGGADVGDVIVGNYAGGQGIFYDKSANSTTFAGTLSAATGTLGAITTGLITLDTSGYLKTSGKDDYADTTAGIFVGYDTDAYKLNIGDATNSLKWDGVNLTYTGLSKITVKLTMPFEDLTRYPNFGSGYMGINNGLYIRAHASATANNYKQVSFTVGSSANSNIMDNSAFSTLVFMRNRGTNEAGNNGNFYIGISGSPAVGDGTTLTLTNAQYGFKVIKTDAAQTLYATNADGTTETTTDLGTISQSDVIFLTAVYQNSQIRFYKNGSLVATHTTNLPPTNTSINMYGRIFVNNANTEYYYDWTIGSYSYEKITGYF